MTNYCTYCGTTLDPDGTCPHCGAMFDPVPAYEEPTEAMPLTDAAEEVETYESVPTYAEPAYEQPYTPYQPEPSYQPPQPEPSASQPNPAPSAGKSGGFDVSELFFEWLDCAKTFFSPDPFQATERVIKGDNYVWAVFALLHVFFASLCTAAMTGNGFNWMVNKIFGGSVAMLNFIESYTFGGLFALFLFGLLTLMGYVCAVAGIEYGFLGVDKKSLPFMTVLRTVSICCFPMTIACAAAFLFSFVLMPMAFVLLVAGMLASLGLLNESIKRQAGEMNFWSTMLCNVAQIVAAMLIVSITTAVI